MIVGWDKPINPLGDCSFTRDGPKLSIRLPGKGHELNCANGRPNAPCLVRDVEGDFVAQVRVGGGFRLNSESGCRRAGLLLTDGQTFFRLQREARAEEDPAPSFRVASGGLDGGEVWWAVDEPPFRLDWPAYLRLERRDGVLRMLVSRDSKVWQPVEMLRGFVPPKFPRSLKVGVMAEATAEGAFKAQFSDFILTPLKK